MLVSRYLRLIVTDICTKSCLHHFLLEFLGTTLFLSASLSALLMLPLAAGEPGLDLISVGNLSHLSHLSHLAPPLSPVSPAGPFQVALVFGLSVAMAAVCVGGEVHINPSVTVAMALTLRLRLWRAVLYVIGQLLGGVASASLLLGLSRDLTPVLNQVSFIQNMINSQSVISEPHHFLFRFPPGSTSTRRSPWRHWRPSSWYLLSWRQSASLCQAWRLLCSPVWPSVWVTWWL